MFRRLVQAFSVTAACALIAGAAIAADDAPDKSKSPALPRSFYQKFLVPRMDSRLDGEVAAAAVFADTAANPWTRDTQTVGRIERGAIGAAKGAVKQYMLQQLQVSNWSFTVRGGRPTVGLDGAPAERTTARVRFGISHMTPRADVLIPAAHGNVIFSADVRGRLSTSFDSHASNFTFGVSLDPTDRSGSFALTRRF